MASLTKCLQAAGELIPVETRAKITAAAEKLRKEGATTEEASRKAVAEVMGERQGALDEIDGAIKEGVTLYETPPPDTPGGKAEAEAALPRVDPVARDFPDMMVKMDDMDAPMRVGDFLAAVKAEADEMAADAPLMELAAQCALING